MRFSIIILVSISILPQLNYAKTALERAAASGDLKKVKKLISQGINVNSIDGDSTWEKTALYAASETGQSEIVAYLLTQGADASRTDIAGATPLRVAAYRGHVQVVKTLLNANVNPDADTDSYGRSPLVWVLLAAKHDRRSVYPDILKLLIAAGAKCPATFTHPVNDSIVYLKKIAASAGSDMLAVFSKACKNN